MKAVFFGSDHFFASFDTLPDDVGIHRDLRQRVLEPNDVHAVLVGFLNGEMNHGVGGVGAVPVAFAGFDPHGIAGANILNWLAGQLDAANSG